MDFHQFLIDFILARKKSDHPITVGINGVDGSGKTVLAGNLTRILEQAGHSVCRISVDDFHHPRQHRYRRGELSPESYYYDSINYEAVANKALKPVFEVQEYPFLCQTKVFDLELDKEDKLFQKIDRDTIILAEGVFLFRPESLPFLNVKIFIEADFKAILERVKIRDIKTLGSAEKIQERYERKYIPGQKLYFEDVNPKNLADIIIDNNDFENPQIKIS